MTPITPKQQPQQPQPIPPSSNDDKGFKKNLREFKEKFGRFNEQILIYGLLIIGLFLLLFTPFIGGLLIGGIAGFIFADEIFNTAIHLKEAIEEEDVSRGVVLGVLCLAFLISAPAIILGAAATACTKKFVHFTEKPETETPETAPKTEGAPKAEAAKTETPPKTEAPPKAETPPPPKTEAAPKAEAPKK